MLFSLVNSNRKVLEDLETNGARKQLLSCKLCTKNMLSGKHRLMNCSRVLKKENDSQKSTPLRILLPVVPNTVSPCKF